MSGTSSRSGAPRLGGWVARVVADTEDDADDKEDNKGKKRHRSAEQGVVDLRQVLNMSRVPNFDSVAPPPDFMLNALPESHLLMVFWYASEEVREILMVDKWRTLLPKKRYPQFCFNGSKYCCYFSDPMACLEHRKRNNHAVNFGMPINAILEQVEGKLREAKRNMLSRRGSPGRRYYNGSTERKSNSATRNSSLSAVSRRSEPRRRDRSTDELAPERSRAASSSKESSKRSEMRISDFLRKERRRASGEYVSSSETSEQGDELAKRSREASSSSKRSSRDRSERRTRDRSSDSFVIRRRPSSTSESSSTISSSSQGSYRDRRERKTERRRTTRDTTNRQDREIPMVSLRGLPKPIPSLQLKNDRKSISSGESRHFTSHDFKRFEPGKRAETETDSESKRAESLSEILVEQSQNSNAKGAGYVQAENHHNSVSQPKELDDSRIGSLEAGKVFLEANAEKEAQVITLPTQGSSHQHERSEADRLLLSNSGSVRILHEEAFSALETEYSSPKDQSSNIKEVSDLHGTNCSTKSQDSSQGLIINEDSITGTQESTSEIPDMGSLPDQKEIFESDGNKGQSKDPSGMQRTNEPERPKSNTECENNEINTNTEKESIDNGEAQSAFSYKEHETEPHQSESAKTADFMSEESPSKNALQPNNEHKDPSGHVEKRMDKQTDHSNEHRSHSNNDGNSRDEPREPSQSPEHTLLEPVEDSQGHLSMKEDWELSQSTPENTQNEQDNTELVETTTISRRDGNHIKQNETTVPGREHLKNQSSLPGAPSKEPSQLKDRSLSTGEADLRPRKDDVLHEDTRGNTKDSKVDESENNQNTEIATEKDVIKTPSYLALETAMEAIHNDNVTSNTEALRISLSNESKSPSKPSAKVSKVVQKKIQNSHNIVATEAKKKKSKKKVESKENTKNASASFADALTQIDNVGNKKKTRKKRSKKSTSINDPLQSLADISKQTKQTLTQTSVNDQSSNGRKRSTSESNRTTLSTSKSTNSASASVTEIPASSTPKRSKLDDKLVLTTATTPTTTTGTTTQSVETATKEASSLSPLPPIQPKVSEENVTITVTATTTTTLISTYESSLPHKRAKIDGDQVQTVPPLEHDSRQSDEVSSGKSPISLTDDENDEGETMNLTKQLTCQLVETEDEKSIVEMTRVLKPVSDFCKVCNAVLDPLKGHYVVNVKKREARITCFDCGSVNKALV